MHCYRAVLEKILVTRDSSLRHTILKTVAKAHLLSFKDYALKATSNLSYEFSPEDFLKPEIEVELKAWWKVVVYYTLRLLYIFYLYLLFTTSIFFTIFLSFYLDLSLFVYYLSLCLSIYNLSIFLYNKQFIYLDCHWHQCLKQLFCLTALYLCMRLVIIVYYCLSLILFYHQETKYCLQLRNDIQWIYITNINTGLRSVTKSWCFAIKHSLPLYSLICNILFCYFFVYFKNKSFRQKWLLIIIKMVLLLLKMN